MTSLSFADYQMPPKFIEEVERSNLSRLNRLKQILETRIYYLKNRESVKEVFVKGVTASEDKELSFSLLSELKKLNLQINQRIEAEPIQACIDFFKNSKKAFDDLTASSEMLLKSEFSGRALGFGTFWDKVKTPRVKLSVEEIRNFLKIELLFQSLNLQENLFLEHKELSSSFFTGYRSCINSKRDEIDRLVSERLGVLLSLRLQLIGQRGAWDVANISNHLVKPAKERINEYRNQFIAVGSVGLLVAAVFPTGILAGIPYSSQIGSTLKIGSVIYGLYFGGKSGYEIYKERQNSQALTRDVHKKLNLQFEQIFSLTENPLDLYQIASAYENAFHKEYIKLSPSETSRPWVTPALERFKSLEMILEAYEEQLKYIEGQLFEERGSPNRDF